MSWEVIIKRKRRVLLKNVEILNDENTRSKIIENPITVGSINSLSIKKLKLLIGIPIPDNILLRLIQTPEVIKGVRFMNIKKLRLILKNTEDIEDGLFDLLINYITINLVNFQKFKLIVDDCPKNLFSLSNFVGNINEIDKEKLKCIIQMKKFLPLEEILENRSIINRIKLFEIERFKLFSTLDYCDNCDVSYELYRTLVRANINAINGLEFEKFSIILGSCCIRAYQKLDLFAKLNTDAVNAINAIHVEKFQLLFNVTNMYVDDNDTIVIFPDETVEEQKFYEDWDLKWLGDPTVARIINLFDIEKFRLIYAGSYGQLMKEIFKNENAVNTVNAINAMNTERFSILLRSQKIRNQCKTRLLSNPDAIATIDTIDIAKLKVLLDVENDVEEVSDLRDINERDFHEGFREITCRCNRYDIAIRNIKRQRRIALISCYMRRDRVFNKINKEESRALASLDESSYALIMDFKERARVMNTDYDERIRATGFYYNKRIREIRNDYERRVREIRNDCDERRVREITNDCAARVLAIARKYDQALRTMESNNYNDPDPHMYFNCNDADLLGNPLFANSLNLIEIKRLKLMQLNYCIHLMMTIFKRPKTCTTINLINLENLRRAFKIMDKNDLMEVFDDPGLDMRINFNFAMNLHKAGFIRNITYDYLSDNKVVYSQVIQMFEKKSPIDQILVKSSINEGNVLNLKYLCLDFILKNNTLFT